MSWIMQAFKGGEGGAKMLFFNFRISLDEIWNWPLYTEGKERPKKEANHSRLVGGRLISKETYIYGWSWVTVRYPNLKVYTEALTEFTHICHPDGLSNTLSSQGCVLEKLLAWECSMKHTFQGQGWGWGASNCSGSAYGSTGSHVLSISSSKIMLPGRCLVK